MPSELGIAAPRLGALSIASGVKREAVEIEAPWTEMMLEVRKKAIARRELVQSAISKDLLWRRRSGIGGDIGDVGG